MIKIGKLYINIPYHLKYVNTFDKREFNKILIKNSG